MFKKCHSKPTKPATKKKQNPIATKWQQDKRINGKNNVEHGWARW